MKIGFLCVQSSATGIVFLKTATNNDDNKELKASDPPPKFAEQQGMLDSLEARTTWLQFVVPGLHSCLRHVRYATSEEPLGGFGNA